MGRNRKDGKPSIKWERDVLPEVKRIIVKYVPHIVERLSIRQIYYLLARTINPRTTLSHIYETFGDYQTLDKKLSQWRDGRIRSGSRRGQLSTVEIDWKVIEDIGRRELSGDKGFWNPHGYIEDEIKWLKNLGYHKNHWRLFQPRYVELWTEKEALTSIILPYCEQYKVPLIPMRGYSSITKVFEAFKRFPKDRPIQILHFGDFDPSGIHATEKIDSSLKDYNQRFFNGKYTILDVKRIALVHSQIIQFNLVPNPKKIDLGSSKKDPNAKRFVQKFKHLPRVSTTKPNEFNSWQLDALEPKKLIEIVKEAIVNEIDEYLWKLAEREQHEELEILEEVWDNFDSVFDTLEQDIKDEYDKLK